jgi:hypothetical protein
MEGFSPIMARFFMEGIFSQAQARLSHPQMESNSAEDGVAEPEVDDDSSWEGIPFRQGSVVHWKIGLRKPKRGWQGSKSESFGIVLSRRQDGVVVANFGSHRCLALVEELVEDEDAAKVKPGIIVRIKEAIVTPKYGWGNVDRGSVGMVKSTSADGEVIVDFAASHDDWKGLIVEVAAVPHDSTVAASQGLRIDAILGLYSFRIGTCVRVKPSVIEPRHQWGQVRPGSVGRCVVKLLSIVYK